MKKINWYKPQKRFVEITFSILVLSFGILLFLYYLIQNKLLLKQNIFIKIPIHRNKNLYQFNTQILFFKNIPLFYNILKGELALVGIASKKIEIFSNLNKEKIGLCSLWFVRKNSKMSNVSVYKCNKEYLKTRSLVSDFTILFKSFISCLYYRKIKNFNDKVVLLDIKFDNLRLAQILKNFIITMETKSKKTVSFINADCLNKTVVDPNYKKTLQQSDYILPDGSGINMACNIINNPLRENLNGTDLFPSICSLAQQHRYSIYLLGAKKGVAEKVKEELLLKYSSLNIVGYHDGYTPYKDMQTLIEDINNSKANILLVALGAPMQEIFIQKYKNKINVNLLLGVGGLFDFYSNRIKRAPLFLRELGFEWVYRMMQEPRRMWRRYILGNPLFLYRVYQYKNSLSSKKLIDTYLQTYESSIFDFKYKNVLWNFQLLCSSFFKRLLDIFVSSIMLVLLSPLFCVVALLIKKESKGDVIFSQNRVGLRGKEFKMYKFRSMVLEASTLQKSLEEKNESKDGVVFKIKDDPRVTKVGRVIRKTSIDELPQLLNVLKGEMSLVGPRPPLPSEVTLYEIEERKRLDMKPGITCIWQVSGRSDIPFKQQVILDKKYIKEHGFVYDIVLLLKTIPAVLFSKGSY